MRQISAGLTEALALESLTLCRLWEVEFVDGRLFYYTDLSLPHVYMLNTYLSDPGITVSTIRNSVTGGLQNATVEIGYSETAITERDVKLGQADDAKYRILMVDYTRPEAGHMELFSGAVVSIAHTDRISCKMEVRGVSSLNAAKTIGEVYSQRCRNVFGDFRCKVDIEALSQPFTVLQVVDPVRFRTRIAGNEEEAPDVSETTTVEYLTPGAFQFQVPPCDAINFELSSAGGGGGTALKGVVVRGDRPYQTNVVIRFDQDTSDGGNFSALAEAGGDAIFGPYIVKGGGAGALNRRVIEDFLSGDLGPGSGVIFIRGESPPTQPQTLPDPLDYFVPPNVPVEVFPGGGAPGGASMTIGNGIFGGGGANGGKIRGTIIVGQPGGVQVGDFLDIEIPEGGDPAGYPPNNYAAKGANGGLKLSYVRNAIEIDNAFNLGTILWTLGNNKGRIDSIAYNREGEVGLAVETIRPILVGDQGVFRPGCSNYADMCENVWNNLINMRAEPVVPQGAGTTAPTPNLPARPDITRPQPVPVTSLDYSGGGLYRSA